MRNGEVELVHTRAEVGRYSLSLKEADRMSEQKVKTVENLERTDRVADQMFNDFCVSIGVSNVRQYEKQEPAAENYQYGKPTFEELCAERVSKKTGLEEEEVDAGQLTLSRVLTLDLNEYEDTVYDVDSFDEVEEETEVFDKPIALFGQMILKGRICLWQKDWHDYKRQKADEARSGIGEHGHPYILSEQQANLPLVDKLYRENGYSGYVSDLLPLYRSTNDVRPKACLQKKYCSKLPSVSVVVPFHNEHLSVLLRSVYSVLYRSPTELLEEVVLVDDASTKPELGKPLDEHLSMNKMDNVRVLRTMGANGKREGLIRARVNGAKVANGDVLVFMDAHSEVGYNWLPPLLQPIVENRRTVTCPFIDVIDCDTFAIRPQGNGARGMFDWRFYYKNVPLLNKTQMPPVNPFENPVMAGGYFAIDRSWFEELGRYDEELMIWGGEQYELSFKVWQCHGRILDVPCSHVAHIYRCKHIPFADPGIGDFLSRNYKRVAEVWMDEFKEYLYQRNPKMRQVDAGDLSKQLAIRKKLKCNSFKWFMTNVMFDQEKYYPASEPPSLYVGSIKNQFSGLCIQYDGNEKSVVKLGNCNSIRTARFTLTWRPDLRLENDDLCLDSPHNAPDSAVVFYRCHGQKGNQAWQYYPNSSRIYQTVLEKCLAYSLSGNVVIRHCREGDTKQKWNWQK
ncbi:Glycos transf 2 and Ricin B lectin domain contain ing protein [Trichuris trichiura]|uniref:Polypeptide N-acetylgalactosaminyltransferase n=1 Tax=Trichuris trichiura TaxID=36087 RepID=A0A077ZG42_TRITR|nr:Glycos transf 2 and Ricin B lectin domain contain ing protein [Trichuris trichiura]